MRLFSAVIEKPDWLGTKATLTVGLALKYTGQVRDRNGKTLEGGNEKQDVTHDGPISK